MPWCPLRSAVSTRGRTVLAAAICVAAAAGFMRGAAAQSLTGSALQPLESTDSLLGDLLDRFVGGGSRDAARPVVERVIVTEDSARRLVLTVTYSAFPPSRLTAEVRGANRRRQPQIQSEAIDLTSAAGEATLSLTLQDGVPEAATLESAYLRLFATDPQRASMPVFSRMYALPKKWQAMPAPANVRLTVAPNPIGTAARLGNRPDYAPPPKVLVPMRTFVPSAMTGVRTDRVMTAPAERVAPPPSPASSATVRDHREGASPAVRDHRGESSATVRDHRNETTIQTKPATAALPPRATVLQIDKFKFGVKPEDAQKGAQGPASAPIELLEGLRTEDIDLNPALLLNIASSVYPDKNPASGIFYYHPRAYHLEWTPESGLGMRILYGAATTAGSAGDVLMAARLESGLDNSEVQLASELLGAYRRRNPSTVFTALRPLPLEKDGVDVSLGAVLGQYSIPKEKIAITGLSDVLGEIDVSWVTDPVTKENLQLALSQDVGVSGMVAFSAAGGALAPQIPLSIQLADRDSYGRVRWNRSEGFRNRTPYPIRLRYLHALVIDPRNNLPILYSWSLDNAEVPPQASVQWDAARVPAWIDSDAKRVWIDYGMVGACEACDRQVLDAITGGVTSIAAEQITFHTITPLADVGGYELTAHVRSRYFDPKDRTQIQKSVVLKADNQDFTVKPIYNGGVAAGDPLFEYQLELAMPDGSIYKGSRWIRSDSLRVLIGRAQLEQSIGALPGK